MGGWSVAWGAVSVTSARGTTYLEVAPYNFFERSAWSMRSIRRTWHLLWRWLGSAGLMSRRLCTFAFCGSFRQKQLTIKTVFQEVDAKLDLTGDVNSCECSLQSQ